MMRWRSVISCARKSPEPIGTQSVSSFPCVRFLAEAASLVPLPWRALKRPYRSRHPERPKNGKATSLRARATTVRTGGQDGRLTLGQGHRHKGASGSGPEKPPRMGHRWGVGKGMAGERKCVVITPDMGVRPWEVPPALWSKVGLLQRIRLRRTVTDHILPVLQELEQLYLKEHFGAKPRIAGRPAAEIEKDDIAIEAALYLFDLALQEGLIEFHAGNSKGKKGISASKPVTKGPVGSCGLDIAGGKAHYLGHAVKIILAQGQRKDADIEAQLKGVEVKTVADLQSVRQLVRFDPLSVAELHKGLKGRLEPLLQQDTVYLDILHKCSPIKFLRALRYALGKNFAEVLKWEPEFITAVAEGLDHSAKIMALGPELLSIEDPDVIRAFGTWAMKEVKPKGGEEGKKKKYVTRIAQVKEAMGSDFGILLTATPAVVEEVGRWTNQEITEIRHYLPHLGPDAIEAMSPLPFDMRVSMLEGFWDRLGRDFVENELKLPGGASVIRNIVKELTDMKKRGSAAKDVKGLITGSDILDHTMSHYLKRRH